MKSACSCRIVFGDENDPQYVLEVSGEISLPALLCNPSKDRKDQSLVGSGPNDDILQINDISYIAKKGVWKPLVWTDYFHSPIAASSHGEHIPWRCVKEDMEEAFLPGYTFFWDNYGSKPLDWVPEGFMEQFG